MRRLWMCAAFGLTLSAGAVAAAPATAPAAPPEFPSKASELMAVPGGGWLALRKSGLLWLDAQGATVAQWPVRASRLDVRWDAQGGVAVALDANAERVVPLRIDLRARTLTAGPPLPVLNDSVSAVCLYRDAQSQAHVFVIGESGVAQQWVLRGDAALPVRDLAVAPEAEHCRVDDRHARLLVSDPTGVWAHRADPEGAPTREAVALRQPLGPLKSGGGPLAVLDGGPAGRVAVADADRAKLLVFERSAAGSKRHGRWRPTRELPLPRGAEPDQIATLESLSKLAVRDDASGRWSWVDVPAAAEAAVAGEPPLPIVMPRVQTDPVAQQGDAADDPAVWVHPGDAMLSRVLGTDKKRGLAVYDLQGRERQFLAVGRVNNVDVRQGVRVAGERLDLAVATQRDDNTVVVFRIDAAGEVSEWGRLPTGLNDVYGLCLHRSPSDAAEVFVNDKDGRVLQLRVGAEAGRPVGTRLREFKLASQPEGCVADDRAGRVFIGEEKRGLWSVAAAADEPLDQRLVLAAGGLLKTDVEGMGVHHGAVRSYLVVSSQGNDSYVVLDAAPPHAVRGAFRIGMNLAAGIDGVSETDGLEVSSVPFGPAFPQGLLVVQDGYKRLPAGPQNFKYVSWEDVVKVLKLP